MHVNNISWTSTVCVSGALRTVFLLTVRRKPVVDLRSKLVRSLTRKWTTHGCLGKENGKMVSMLRLLVSRSVSTELAPAAYK